jgi:hypothetical protein
MSQYQGECSNFSWYFVKYQFKFCGPDQKMICL